MTRDSVENKTCLCAACANRVPQVPTAALSQGVALARHRLVGTDIESGALLRPFLDRSVRLPDAYWIVMPSSSRNRRDAVKVVDWLKAQGAQQP